MIPAEAHDLFQELCRSASEVLVSTHLQPDGDAIGSEQGLARFLADGGARVRVINGDPTPEALRFVEDPAIAVETYDPARHDTALRQARLIVLVDNSAPDRLGRIEPVLVDCAAHVLCIDHHPARSVPWRHNIVDVRACATALMIYELTAACGWTPGRRAAEALYVGLATDTGFFRFDSANPRAHRAAASLLESGASPARAYGEIYERNSEPFTRLLGHALAGLRLEADGAIAVATVTRELERAVGAEDVDASEITTQLLALDGVLVALLYRELAGQRVKVSLRSKGDVDVHALATEFGGGGHRNASGIVLAGPLVRVVEQITARATALLAARPAG